MQTSCLYKINKDAIVGIILAMQYDLSFDDNNYNYNCNDSSDNREKLALRLRDILTFHGYKAKDYNDIIRENFSYLSEPIS